MAADQAPRRPRAAGLGDRDRAPRIGHQRPHAGRAPWLTAAPAPGREECRPTLDTIDFFVYSRALPNTDHDPALDEEHWSYMDAFADAMTARGPTLAADRATWTGSVHIVDLPSAEAAHEFVEREPYNRAGLFERHTIRRFNNLLGRTMWDYRGASDDARFLVIADMRLPELTSHPIVHGELLTLDEATPAGVVVALQAPTREAVEALLTDSHADAQILDWEFGGRR